MRCSPGGAAALLVSVVAGCASPELRRLDPAHRDEVHLAEMKFRFEPGVSDARLLDRLEAGDIIALSADDDSGGSSGALGAALSAVSHVALVFPFYRGKLAVLSADSDRGVYVDSVEGSLRGRGFYVFAFPAGHLDFDRIDQFAERAVHLGRLDYDWSAIFGLNSNLTPNTLREIGDEHTCASVVAAALHYGGLSLDRAWRGVVTPGDVVFSPARRNLNGLRRQAAGPERSP